MNQPIGSAAGRLDGGNPNALLVNRADLVRGQGRRGRNALAQVAVAMSDYEKQRARQTLLNARMLFQIGLRSRRDYNQEIAKAKDELGEAAVERILRQ